MNIITKHNVGEKKTDSCTINLECRKNKDNKQIIQNEKQDIIDFLSEKVINKNDINDTVTMPRTIFKGYLCFTTGTLMNGIAQMLKNTKIKTGLMIAGSLASIYGTFNFVKPYLFKENNLTKKEK